MAFEDDLENVSPLKELGSPGVQHYSGQLDEDFLTELEGRSKLEAYKEMSHNDAVVSAILYAIDQLMKQVEWNVRPPSSDQKHLEAANFLEECMNDMTHPWSRMIGQSNNRLTYGFAPMEQVYKRRDGDNSKFSDGRIGWKKIEIRRPDTLYEWIYDDDDLNKLIGMTQRNPTTFDYIDIPIEKLLLFTVQGEGGSPEGRSLLRGAFRSWYFKKKVEEIEAIGIERDSVGIPVAELPPEYFGENADQDQKNILSRFETMVKNLRRNEDEGLVIPRSFDEDGNKRFNLELIESGGERQIDPGETIQRYREAIATSLLSDFLLLGQSDQVGSFALSRDKTSLFSLAVESLLDDIEGKFNNKSIPQLFEMNDFGIEKYPKIEHDDIRKEDVADIGKTMKDLSAAGATPFAQDEQNQLLNTILKQMNLPTVEEQQAPSQEATDTVSETEESPLEQLQMDKATHGVGDWVKWTSSGGTAFGKIDEVVREGCTSRGKGSMEVCAEDGDPAVVVEVYDDETGESKNELVRHKMSTLNMWDGPTEKSIEKDINTTPTQEMANNAQMALDARDDSDLDNDECGTRVGWERANQLVNGEELSEETIGRMVSFFSRHDGNQEVEDGPRGEDCGWLMWKAWGGQAGFDWAKRKQEQLEKSKDKGRNTFKTEKELQKEKLDMELKEKELELMERRQKLIEELE